MSHIPMIIGQLASLTSIARHEGHAMLVYLMGLAMEEAMEVQDHSAIKQAGVDPSSAPPPPAPNTAAADPQA